jgi:hypothetical protein
MRADFNMELREKGEGGREKREGKRVCKGLLCFIAFVKRER